MIVLPKYDCTQDELYTGLNLLKASLEEELAAFGLHKVKYDAPFVVAFKGLIDTADAIPDASQREAVNEGFRILLTRRLKAETTSLVPAEGELNLGRLRSYIEASYSDKALRKARLKEAGFEDYDKVMRFNWDVVRGVMQKGKKFIDDYNADLTTNGSMPAGFELTFDTMADSIIAQLDLYLVNRENIKQMTQDKIVANNVAYDAGMEICGDGQTIFQRNPAKKVQFIWDRILEIVTPPGAAGLRGSVKVNGSNYPIVGAVIEMQTTGGTPVIFATDAEGKYYSGNLPVGVYTFKLTKPGFATLETEVVISTGTTSYKHWLMNTGGGTVVIVDGALGLNEIANVPLPVGVNDDTWLTLEGLGTQQKYYAADVVNGEQTGTGALYADTGAPVEKKWSQVVAEIGLAGVHTFFNVKNTGGGSGSWRVTFVIS